MYLSVLVDAVSPSSPEGGTGTSLEFQIHVSLPQETETNEQQTHRILVQGQEEGSLGLGASR